MGWFLLALVLGALFARAAIPNIAPASDLWDYSQESRQLARDEGFTSLYTYPVFLGQDHPPFPVRWRMPLYAMLGALLLRLGISLPAGFLYLGALAHAFLVALTYWLGARVSSSPRAGSWAAAGTLACPLLLDFYNPGMSHTVAALFVMVTWTCLLGSRGALAACFAGIFAAAAWYTREESLLFVPIWIWVAARHGRRAALSFSIAFAALVLPWALRSGGVDVNPTLLYTPEYPGVSSLRVLGARLPGFAEYITQHPLSFFLRLMKDGAKYLLDLLGGVGPIVFLLAARGALLQGWSGARAIFREHTALVIAILFELVAISALERSPRFLVPIVPLVFVLLGIFSAPALTALGRREVFLALALLAVVERGAHVHAARRDALRRFPPADSRSLDALDSRDRDSLVLSDAPDWVSWHADRPALLLPMSAQLDSLVAARPVAAIWLSPGARWRNVADRDTGWVTAIDRNDGLPGFSGPEALPGGSRLYVIK